MFDSNDKTWRVPLPTLVRKGKEIDTTRIPLGKILDAQEKGYRFEIPTSWAKSGKVKAKVTRIVVEGDT